MIFFWGGGNYLSVFRLCYFSNQICRLLLAAIRLTPSPEHQAGPTDGIN